MPGPDGYRKEVQDGFDGFGLDSLLMPDIPRMIDNIVNPRLTIEDIRKVIREELDRRSLWDDYARLTGAWHNKRQR